MVLFPARFGLADATQATQVSFLMVALWWALFSAPLFRGVREPGPAAGGSGWGEIVAMLREVQRLSQEEGVNLSGIKRILELEAQVAALEGRLDRLSAELDAVRQVASRVFAAGPAGDVVAVEPGRRPPRRPTTSALVVWRPQR